MLSRRKKIIKLLQRKQLSKIELSRLLKTTVFNIYNDLRCLLHEGLIEEKGERILTKGSEVLYGIADKKNSIPKNFKEYRRKWRGFEINYNSFAKYCYRGAKD